MNHSTAIGPSAKVIVFPVRPGWDARAQARAGVAAVRRARMPKLKPILFLLAPLIVVGSLLSFLAVVGIFLIWLIIVTLMVIGMILFARRFLRRRKAAVRGGFRPRPIG